MTAEQIPQKKTPARVAKEASAAAWAKAMELEQELAQFQAVAEVDESAKKDVEATIKLAEAAHKAFKKASDAAVAAVKEEGDRSAKNAKKVAEQRAVARPCVLSFSEKYSGPSPRIVRLPNGAAVRLELGSEEHGSQAVQLSQDAARQYEKSGLSVTFKKAS